MQVEKTVACFILIKYLVIIPSNTLFDRKHIINRN